jgi:hypothetical protein
MISIVNGQQLPNFAISEAQRVYDLLDGLGCIGNALCPLTNFTKGAECGYNLDYMSCDSKGYLDRL